MENNIALLATGDEILNGDILNSSSQHIAAALTDAGYTVTTHMSVGDDVSIIEQAMKNLLSNHRVLITTGGLGPTSDDLTRFALGKVVDEELVFCDESWQRIVKRFSALNIEINDSNRQQALFPANAQLFANDHGTADGCGIQFKDKYICMLPGPPRECMPMFHQFLIPALQQHIPAKVQQVKKWRLFGVVEASAAPQLDDALRDITCTTGFRIEYPYLEFKVFTDIDNMDDIEQALRPVIEPYLLCDQHQRASDFFKDYLINQAYTLSIDDRATRGRLQNIIYYPDTSQQLRFTASKDANAIEVAITGLDEVWKSHLTKGTDKFTLHIKYQDKQQETTDNIPFRHERSLDYAVELICFRLWQFMLAIT